MRIPMMVSAVALTAGLGAAGAASAAILFDQNVTPVNGVSNGMIMGSGIDNGSFTVERAAGVEVGLRGKLRHNAGGAPENTFNSNGDGTYSFAAGVAPTQSFPTGVWSFEWAINSNYDGSSGANLDALTYELGYDSDPTLATSFSTFDPINDPNPGSGDGHWDHSIGTNATAGGAGTEASDLTTYNLLIANNNVAQQSWKAHWFLAGFDPTLDATYDFYLAAFSGGAQLARTQIQIIVGQGGSAAVAEPTTVVLFGVGLLGVALRRRRPTP